MDYFTYEKTREQKKTKENEGEDGSGWRGRRRDRKKGEEDNKTKKKIGVQFIFQILATSTLRDFESCLLTFSLAFRSDSRDY